jgi:nucleoside-diphosphate-sugar epimerase
MFSMGYYNDFQCLQNIEGLHVFDSKQVIITGATGLIGSCLADAFLFLQETLGISIDLCLAGRDETATQKRFESYSSKFRYVYYDALSDFEVDVKPDYVFHCASNAHPAAYASNPVETALINIKGTNTLLDMLSVQKHGRMIYVSTSEVYGKKMDGAAYKEDDYEYVDTFNPRAAYPVSKRAAENLCACYKDEYGVDFVVVRPGHIYGPTITESDSRAHAQFSRNAANGESIIMKSAGAQLRSYCYVVDCVSAIIFAALHGESGEAYNISNPDSDCTIFELASALADVARVDLKREIPSDQERRGYNLMENSALNSEKLRALGWVPVFDLKQGARLTVEYLRNRFFHKD